jgi:DNA-binding beta-propeller fold protein YncE
MRTIVFCLLAVALLTSCKDDEPIIPPNPTSTSHKVVVLNEGGFQRGNASLGLYDFLENTYESEVFKASNQIPLGDVLNGGRYVNGDLWLVVNSSGVIRVLDSSTLELKHTITGFNSPRYVHPISANKAYVTDLYADQVYVLDTRNMRVVRDIKFNGWSEHIELCGGDAWISNRDQPFLYQLDILNDEIIDSIRIGNNPNSMAKISDSKVAVLCEGILGSNEKTRLYVIDLNQKVISDSLVFDELKPTNLRVDASTGNLYVTDEGVHYIDPINYDYQEKVIELPKTVNYAFDIDGSTGRFYISDAKDYLKQSAVYIFDRNFRKVAEFDAGVITKQFIFP